MYINDSDDLRDAILRTLKTHGIKPRCKREPPNRRRQNDVTRGNSIIFRIPLEQLPSTEVCLDCGAYVSVPCIVVQLCDRILIDVHTEGIFRKNGSQARQHDIKVMLEKGGRITSSHHVIDVAVLLKEFLRCLPTPLIPYSIHDDFIKCLTLSDKCLESMLLLTLVIPPSHLNVLAYVMQVLNQISSQSAQNKMNAHNLSVVIAPNVMPSTSRNTYMCANALARSESCRRIIEDLITNASLIGSIPSCVQISHLASSLVNTPNEDYAPSNRRKRRSASLTRMFSGLKRMVAKTNAPEDSCETPPEQRTPSPPLAVTSPGGKKRKCPQEVQPALGFSAKKRKELMRGFAEHGITLLSPKIIITPGCDESDGFHNAPVPAKKKFFSHSASNLKKSTTSLKEKARKSFSGTGLKISRLKLRKSKSKEKGLDAIDQQDVSERDTADAKTLVEDYVCLPKREYELIEQRVSQIENAISAEFENERTETEDGRGESKRRRPSIENVQSEYAKTLDKVEHLNTTCDNLAERLGRDLRIRRSYDGSRVHRSPSARKIGSIRRRSKERPSKPVVRHRSLNLHDKSPSYKMERNRSIRRGKPNAVQNGLHNALRSEVTERMGKDTTERITRQTAPRRAQSCLVGAKRTHIPVKQPGWNCAPAFLSKAAPHMLQETRRDSIAKLKAQNAGMVMAKAKLFDHFADENEKVKIETGEGSVKQKTRLSTSNQFMPHKVRNSLIIENTTGRQPISNGNSNNTSKFSTIENSTTKFISNKNSNLRKSLPENSNRVRKSLSDVTDKENLLSETLENIIYDTCKVRTPDMPIIKKPLTGTRSISFRQPPDVCRTPVSLNALTPRRSPRLVQVNSRPMVS